LLQHTIELRARIRSLFRLRSSKLNIPSPILDYCLTVLIVFVTHDVNDYYSVINGSMGCHSDELGTQEIRARKCGTWVSRKLLSTKTSEIAQLLLLTNMEAVKQYLLPVVTSAILTATGLALWQSSKRFVPKEKQRGTFKRYVLMIFSVGYWCTNARVCSQERI
jgi:hypothetical protein